MWKSRSLSYAGRLRLIQSVIFGIFNFWASIFLIPKGVTNTIMSMCRDFLWGKEEGKHAMAHVSWEELCLPKKYGGTGIRHLYTWNVATVSKLVWDVERKKDVLWVKWIHARYLRNLSWMEFNPPFDSCWYLKKICSVKENLKDLGLYNQVGNEGRFSVKGIYELLTEGREEIGWEKIIWFNGCIPKHSFIWWLLMKRRLPVKERLRKFMDIDSTCILCHNETETLHHLFLTCDFAKTLWYHISKWMQVDMSSMLVAEWAFSPNISIISREAKGRMCITVAAVIYQVWTERNRRIFKGHQHSAE